MKWGSAYFCVAGILALAQFGLMMVRSADNRTLSRPLSEIPLELAGWNAVRNQQLTDRALGLLRPAEYLGRVYEKNGQEVSVFIAYYAAQRAGEAMHSPRNCLPGDGWTIEAHEHARMPWRGRSAAVNQLKAVNAGQPVTALYWYQSADRIIANEFRGKLLLVADALTQRRTDGVLVRLLAPAEPGGSGDVHALAAELISYLDGALAAVGRKPGAIIW